MKTPQSSENGAPKYAIGKTQVKSTEALELTQQPAPFRTLGLQQTGREARTWLDLGDRVLATDGDSEETREMLTRIGRRLSFGSAQMIPEISPSPQDPDDGPDAA